MAWFHYHNLDIEQAGLESNSKNNRWIPHVSNRRSALILSYAPDWMITILVGGLFFILGHISGFKREFSLNDTSIQHTFAVHERISNTSLFLIAAVAPLVLLPAVNFLTIRSFWDWHISWLGLICSLAFAGTVTNIVKVTVGRPRPDAIDRCQPGLMNVPVFGLVTAAICTQTDKSILDDGWRSFFSGHASLSFAGLGFLTLYLAGKLHLFDKRGHAGKAWLALIPLVGATLVSISRIMDYRHHSSDVLIGAIVGSVFAYFAYRQYYPPLDDPLSHLPHCPRIDRPPEALLPQHTDVNPVRGMRPIGENHGSYRHSGSEEQEIADAVEHDRMHEHIPLGEDRNDEVEGGNP